MIERVTWQNLRIACFAPSLYATTLTSELSLQFPPKPPFFFLFSRVESFPPCRTYLFLRCTTFLNANGFTSTLPSFAAFQFLPSRLISRSTLQFPLNANTVALASPLVGSNSSPQTSLIPRSPDLETCGFSSRPDTARLVSTSATVPKERIGHRGLATISLSAARAAHPRIRSSTITHSASSTSFSMDPSSPGPTPRLYPLSCTHTRRYSEWVQPRPLSSGWR